ncbi:MAG TPA: MFS transporter [Bryobacteraceae bacterium]|nr:MFS transporter [Bryobacteraceae bacterium]
MPVQQEHGIIESDVPARLDRLPWSLWHWRIVIALGITWLLDGLETMLGGALVGILKDPRTLHLTDADIGLSATVYLAGAVIGALVFGYATDRLGRKRLFFITLGVYLFATAATAFSWNFWSFCLFRSLTGAGIGGEYAAINSAVDELIPARIRGHVDLVINSTFWIGAFLGSLGAVLLLHMKSVPPTLSWRFVFGIGAVLGLGVLMMRRYVPESPRWLLIHGRKEEAEQVVGEIEQQVSAGRPLAAPEGVIRLQVQDHTPWRSIWEAMTGQYRERSMLGFSLMVSQAFFYNAIMFTYGLVLLRYYNVPAESVGYWLLPLALGNFLGPLLIGRLFDTLGRRLMITITYSASGILLAIASWLFLKGWLSLYMQAIAWSVIFFIASAAASSAYLTVSEVFPLEIRALAIAVFYACGTLLGGVGAPALFGALTETGSRAMLFWGYIVGAALMVGAALIEWTSGVAAERMPLESVSAPLSSRKTAGTSIQATLLP